MSPAQTTAQTTARELSALRADLAAMSLDMRKLMSDRASGLDHAAHAAAQQAIHLGSAHHSGLNGGSSTGYGSLGTEVVRNVKSAAGLLEKRPILSVLLAVGVGWLGGRLLAR